MGLESLKSAYTFDKPTTYSPGAYGLHGNPVNPAESRWDVDATPPIGGAPGAKNATSGVQPARTVPSGRHESSGITVVRSTVADKTSPIKPIRLGVPDKASPVTPNRPPLTEKAASPVDPNRPTVPEKTSPVSPVGIPVKDKASPVDPNRPPLKEKMSPVDPNRPPLKDKTSAIDPPKRALKDKSSDVSPAKRQLKDKSSDVSPAKRELKDKASSINPIRRELKDKASSIDPTKYSIKLGDVGQHAPYPGSHSQWGVDGAPTKYKITAGQTGQHAPYPAGRSQWDVDGQPKLYKYRDRGATPWGRFGAQGANITPEPGASMATEPNGPDTFVPQMGTTWDRLGGKSGEKIEPYAVTPGDWGRYGENGANIKADASPGTTTDRFSGATWLRPPMGTEWDRKGDKYPGSVIVKYDIHAPTWPGEFDTNIVSVGVPYQPVYLVNPATGEPIKREPVPVVPRPSRNTLIDPLYIDHQKRFGLRASAHNSTYMKEPYLLFGIQEVGKTKGPNLLLNTTMPVRLVDDAARLAKYVASPDGLLFTAKQEGLQLMNAMGTLPERLYNPASPLLNVPAAPIRRTFVPLTYHAYELLATSDATWTTGRMNLMYDEVRLTGRDRGDIIALTKVGGPNSIMGIGKTTHTMTDSMTGRKPKTLPIIGPNVVNNYYHKKFMPVTNGMISDAFTYPKQLDSAFSATMGSRVVKLTNDIEKKMTWATRTIDALAMGSVIGPLFRATNDFATAKQVGPENKFVDTDQVRRRPSPSVPFIADMYSSIGRYQALAYDKIPAKTKRGNQTHVVVDGKEDNGSTYRGKDLKGKYKLPDDYRYYDTKQPEPDPNQANYTGLASYPENDFIRFYMSYIDGGKASSLFFRATITGFTDTYTPTWNAMKVLGRADSLHIYDAFAREVSFTFTVAVNSSKELLPTMKRLNELAKFTTPEYISSSGMKGPLMRLTLGNYLDDMPGFLSALTFTVPDESPWEIDRSVGQFPHVVEVAMTYVVVHKNLPSKNIGEFISVSSVT